MSQAAFHSHHPPTNPPTHLKLWTFDFWCNATHPPTHPPTHLRRTRAPPAKSRACMGHVDMAWTIVFTPTHRMVVCLCPRQAPRQLLSNALFSNTHHALPCIRASSHICLGASGACMGHMGMAWTDFLLACTAWWCVLCIFKGRANAFFGVARFVCTHFLGRSGLWLWHGAIDGACFCSL